MIIEIFGFWCPLTALETWLEVRGNVPAYRGPFLLHYLDAVVYPDIPSNLLTYCGRCRRLHFESRDLRPASLCPTLARITIDIGHRARKLVVETLWRVADCGIGSRASPISIQ